MYDKLLKVAQKFEKMAQDDLTFDDVMVGVRDDLTGLLANEPEAAQRVEWILERIKSTDEPGYIRSLASALYDVVNPYEGYNRIKDYALKTMSQASEDISQAHAIGDYSEMEKEYYETPVTEPTIEMLEERSQAPRRPVKDAPEGGEGWLESEFEEVPGPGGGFQERSIY
jgi:hypothetical protein